MSRYRVANNLPGFRNFVNIAVALMANVLMAAAFFSAVGRLAGTA